MTIYGFPEFDPLKDLDLKDEVGEVTVSTVYIHAMDMDDVADILGGPYETMLFRNFRRPGQECMDYMWRYRTIEEAIKNHAELVAVLQSFEVRGWSDELWKAVTDVGTESL